MNFILLSYSIFIISFFIFFKKISEIVNLYDVPNLRKTHKDRISLSGGILVFTSFYLYLILASVYDLKEAEIIFQFNTQNINFLIISLLFFLIGLIDDNKNLSANKKIFLFMFLILFSVNIDTSLQLQLLTFSFLEKNILLQGLSPIFSIFAIFIFINSLNMYDGSNAQLGVYVSVFILYLAYKTNSLFVLYFILPIIFFLILNVRNITFMGNSGAYFLGFFLSFLTIKIYNSELASFMTSDEIFLIMFYPIIDLVRLFFFRIYNDRNPFVGDRNHIHHIIQNKVTNNNKVQIILFIITALPLILYEFSNLTCLPFIIANFIVYFFLVRKNLFSNYYNK